MPKLHRYKVFLTRVDPKAGAVGNMTVTVEAYDQTSAKAAAEGQHPGYKATAGAALVPGT